MVISPLRAKSHHHNRSVSLPSKINPATFQLDETLSSVKGSETSCSSWSSMISIVKSLKDLYVNIDDLLLLPHIRQIISQECQKKLIDQILDGYIRLLDACTTAKDLIANTKQDVQEQLSAMRRKDMDRICCYLGSRKKLKKNIKKSLKDLRSFRSKQNIASLELDSETTILVYKLKDAESVTTTMLESLLLYLMGTRTQARQRGWSLVTKLMNSRKEMNYQGEETNLNEFEKMDAFLQMRLQDKKIEELINLLK